MKIASPNTTMSGAHRALLLMLATRPGTAQMGSSDGSRADVGAVLDAACVLLD